MQEWSVYKDPQGLPLAIYSYCSGHGLSLICQEAVSSHPDLKKTQENIRGILAFIQYSPRRRSEFKALVVVQAEEEILLEEEEGRPAVPQPKGNLRSLCYLLGPKGSCHGRFLCQLLEDSGLHDRNSRRYPEWHLL